MHVIAAKAVAFGEALGRDFRRYQEQVLENARVLAKVMQERGLRIVSGGTDCHMFLVDLRAKKITGKDAEAALAKVQITVNKNAIPNDPEKPFVTSGIRIGSPADHDPRLHRNRERGVGPSRRGRARCPARQSNDRQGVGERRRTQSEVSSLRTARAAVMKCPFCGSADTQVIDSRVSEPGDSIRRRRRCTSCQKRFTTYETVELRLPQVVKTNGTRSDFDVGKLRNGFQRALHKRPVPTEFVDQAVDRIVGQVLALGEREIPSRQIGEMVMQELYKLDKVAYIRFASVYRSFQDVEDFREAVRKIKKR